MAVNDFTGKNIQDTYQRVVQTDGTNLADGTGSLLPISIDGNDVTISGSLTANEYIVSSSVTNITVATLSGSTNFGDSQGDTHKFTGSLYLANDLKVRDGFVIGPTVTSEETNLANPKSNVVVDGDLYLQSHITASGNISSSGDLITSNIIGTINGGYF